MKNSTFKNILILSAAIKTSELGFILTCDPEILNKDIEQAITFKWKSGTLSQAKANFSAKSICIIEHPEYAIIRSSPEGFFEIQTRSALTFGNIFESAQPSGQREIYGSIHGVRSIGGKAFAVGFGGVAYRMDSIGQWTWIGEELPASFDITAADGFSEADIYACGFKGAIWHFNGEHWQEIDSPTNATLNKIKCAPNGIVYVAGKNGILLKGRGDDWKIIDHKGTESDFWGVEYFGEKLYLSTFSGIFTLNGDLLDPVYFGDEQPETTHTLAVCADCIWSVGDHDIVSFDGKDWSRIV